MLRAVANQPKMIQLPDPATAMEPRQGASLESYGWRGRIRIARIGWAAFKLRTAIWLNERGWTGESPESRRRAEGERLRNELIALGPVFIKIGQMLSTRVDLLPFEYTEALRELLDRVPPFPDADAYSIIEEELGQPVRDLYASIDSSPIASASLGQVYRARLRSGEEVVVKVQRPGLEERIGLDIATLRHFAPRMQVSDVLKATDWSGVIDEFASVIADEIDYVKEVENAETFRANFASWPSIHVPKVFPELSTRRVITMEYIPGVKVDDHPGLRRLGLAPSDVTERLVQAYLKQLLEDGFFHADPHPGNLRIMHDGRLAFFDFGMAGRISLELQSKLVDAFFYIVEKDWRGLLRAAAGLGFLRIDPLDHEGLDHIGTKLIEQYEGLRLGDLTFRDMSEEVAELLYRYPFQIPPHFTFVLRALTTIEGIGSKADPDFNFFLVARPHAKEFMLRREGRYFAGRILSRVLKGDEGSIDWSKTWKLAKMAWKHYTGPRTARESER